MAGNDKYSKDSQTRLQQVCPPLLPTTHPLALHRTESLPRRPCVAAAAATAGAPAVIISSSYRLCCRRRRRRRRRRRWRVTLQLINADVRRKKITSGEAYFKFYSNRRQYTGIVEIAIAAGLLAVFVNVHVARDFQFTAHGGYWQVGLHQETPPDQLEYLQRLGFRVGREVCPRAHARMCVCVCKRVCVCAMQTREIIHTARNHYQIMTDDARVGEAVAQDITDNAEAAAKTLERQRQDRLKRRQTMAQKAEKLKQQRISETPTPAQTVSDDALFNLVNHKY